MKLDNIMNICELITQLKKLNISNNILTYLLLSYAFCLPFSIRGNNYSNFCDYLFFVVFSSCITCVYTYTTYCLIQPIIELYKNGVIPYIVFSPLRVFTAMLLRAPSHCLSLLCTLPVNQYATVYLHFFFLACHCSFFLACCSQCGQTLAKGASNSLNVSN